MDILHISDKSLTELEQLFACNIEDDDFYDVMAFNIERSKPGYWLEHINSLDPMRQRAATFGLGLSKAPRKQLTQALMALAESQNERIASQAVDSLRRLNVRRAKALVKRLMQHTSPYVRGAAIRFMAFALESEAIPVIAPCLHDSDPIVRQNAIDELSELCGDQVIALIPPEERRLPRGQAGGTSGN